MDKPKVQQEKIVIIPRPPYSESEEEAPVAPETAPAQPKAGQSAPKTSTASPANSCCGPKAEKADNE